MEYAGMQASKADRKLNYQRDECGCELVRCGPPINNWVRINPCPEHDKKAL